MTSKASLLLTASIRARGHISRKWLPHNPYRRKLTSGTFAEPESSSSPPATSRLSEKPYRIQTSLLINRSPTLTRMPTSFEAAYQEYNARIARALSNPFPTDFYFKPGSVLETQFKKEEKQREIAAFNWGKGRRVEAPESEEVEVEDNTNSATGILGREEEPVIMPRVTDADHKNDVKSLNRKGHRNLYLLIKKNRGRDDWRLPGASSALQEGELLHEVAKRELHAECGVNLDAWIVGRHPIGFMDEPLPPALSSQFAGCKTFFFKAHILAGQIDSSAGSLTDFAWLTKREIKRAVTPEYWINIKDILSDF